MLVEFKVDKKKKRILERKLRQTSGSMAFRAFKRFFFWFSLAAPIAFCIYAYFLSDEFVYRHDRYGTLGQKNTLFILVVAGAVFIILLMFTLIFSVLENGFANKDTHYRISESLFIEGDILRYCYRNYMHARPRDMVVVKIRLSDTAAHYTIENGAIQFSGPISSVYYEDYELQITQGKESFTHQDFLVYDYFTPSLWQHLNQYFRQ